MAEKQVERRGQPTVASSAIHVEVVYALPTETVVIPLELAAGATVREAVERSDILRNIPGSVFTPDRVGVFGKSVQADAKLRDGDRVEIYRPLIAEPKAARTARVQSRKRR